MLSKQERLAEVFRRILEAPRASSFEQAYRQLCDNMNAVENDLTPVPFNPDNWEDDGRLYPPQLDNLEVIPGRPSVKRLRSLKHTTCIGENGAIEIRVEPSEKVVFCKPGSDSRSIDELP